MNELYPDFRPTPEYHHLVREAELVVQQLQSATFWLQKALCDAEEIAVDREAKETEEYRKSLEQAP